MRVLVRAFLNKNLGDDLFVYILCQRYKKTKFYIIGETKYNDIAKNISNLHFIAEDSPVARIMNKIYKAYQRIKHETVCNSRNVVMLNILSRFFDENVFVTGSYFIQNDEWIEMLDSRWYDSHPYILGCNFGPYKDEKYYIEHKKQFAKTKKISFRDKYSYELFKDLPVADYAPDIVFNLREVKKEAKDYYIISVVNFQKDNDQELMKYQDLYITYLVNVINQIINKRNDVVLMSFCDLQGDMLIIDQILERISNKDRVRVSRYEKEGLERSLELISECKGIVASRYHAMILGMIYEKKILPVVYSSKMENVLKDMDYTGRIVYVHDLDKYMDEDVISDMHEIDNRVLQNLRKKASNNFKELDQKFI